MTAAEITYARELKTFHRWSFQRIAALFDVSPNTIRARLDSRVAAKERDRQRNPAVRSRAAALQVKRYADPEYRHRMKLYRHGFRVEN